MPSDGAQCPVPKNRAQYPEMVPSAQVKIVGWNFFQDYGDLTIICKNFSWPQGSGPLSIRCGIISGITVCAGICFASVFPLRFYGREPANVPFGPPKLRRTPFGGKFGGIGFGVEFGAGFGGVEFGGGFGGVEFGGGFGGVEFGGDVMVGRFSGSFPVQDPMHWDAAEPSAAEILGSKS